MKYDDIINLEHHTSGNHPRMSMYQRAAQFAPFAALTGHGAAIIETARLTDSQEELEEHGLRLLNEKMRFLLSHIDDMPEISLTHFVADKKKNGGRYIVTTGKLTKWDEYKQVITLDNSTCIQLSAVVNIEGKIFNDNYSW